ncbi:hypothetical protein YC2023_085326 [Brassica napus]
MGKFETFFNLDPPVKLAPRHDQTELVHIRPKVSVFAGERAATLTSSTDRMRRREEMDQVEAFMRKLCFWYMSSTQRILVFLVILSKIQARPHKMTAPYSVYPIMNRIFEPSIFPGSKKLSFSARRRVHHDQRSRKVSNLSSFQSSSRAPQLLWFQSSLPKSATMFGSRLRWFSPPSIHNHPAKILGKDVELGKPRSRLASLHLATPISICDQHQTRLDKVINFGDGEQTYLIPASPPSQLRQERSIEIISLETRRAKLIVGPKRINKRSPPSCRHASKDIYELVGSNTNSTSRHISQHHHSLTNTQANNLLSTHDFNTRLRISNSSPSEITAQPLVTKQKNRSHFYEYSPSKSSESSEMLEVVFQIWKTSWTTYLLVVWKSSGLLGSLLTKSSGLPGNRLDFREVVWTSGKSSELHGSLLTKFFRSGFNMQVFQIWKTSGTTYLLIVWKSSGLLGSLLTKSSELPVKSSGLPVKSSGLPVKSSGLPVKSSGSRLNFLKVFSQMIVGPKRINKRSPPSCRHASKDIYELVGSNTNSTSRHISQHHHSLTNTQANNLLSTHDFNTRLRINNSSMVIHARKGVKRYVFKIYYFDLSISMIRRFEYLIPT